MSENRLRGLSSFAQAKHHSEDAPSSIRFNECEQGNNSSAQPPFPKAQDRSRTERTDYSEFEKSVRGESGLKLLKKEDLPRSKADPFTKTSYGATTPDKVEFASKHNEQPQALVDGEEPRRSQKRFGRPLEAGELNPIRSNDLSNSNALGDKQSLQISTPLSSKTAGITSRNQFECSKSAEKICRDAATRPSTESEFPRGVREQRVIQTSRQCHNANELVTAPRYPVTNHNLITSDGWPTPSDQRVSGTHTSVRSAPKREERESSSDKTFATVCPLPTERLTKIPYCILRSGSEQGTFMSGGKHPTPDGAVERALGSELPPFMSSRTKYDSAPLTQIFSSAEKYITSINSRAPIVIPNEIMEVRRGAAARVAETRINAAIEQRKLDPLLALQLSDPLTRDKVIKLFTGLRNGEMPFDAKSPEGTSARALIKLLGQDGFDEIIKILKSTRGLTPPRLDACFDLKTQRQIQHHLDIILAAMRQNTGKNETKDGDRKVRDGKRPNDKLEPSRTGKTINSENTNATKQSGHRDRREPRDTKTQKHPEQMGSPFDKRDQTDRKLLTEFLKFLTRKDQISLLDKIQKPEASLKAFRILGELLTEFNNRLGLQPRRGAITFNDVVNRDLAPQKNFAITESGKSISQALKNLVTKTNDALFETIRKTQSSHATFIDATRSAIEGIITITKRTREDHRNFSIETNATRADFFDSLRRPDSLINSRELNNCEQGELVFTPLLLESFTCTRKPAPHNQFEGNITRRTTAGNPLSEVDHTQKADSDSSSVTNYNNTRTLGATSNSEEIVNTLKSLRATCLGSASNIVLLNENTRIRNTKTEMSSVFAISLEIRRDAVWTPLVIYEIYPQHATRTVYSNTRRFKQLHIDLPSLSAEELANTDIGNNWKKYVAEY